MFEELPSLLGFQPKFYTGGPTRFHLALLYDLVAKKKPKSIVTLGFGDGQAFFSFCQAARERNLECQIAAARRQRVGEKAGDDHAWIEGRDYGEEFYGDAARFLPTPTAEAAKEFADGSVDLLFLDDFDSGEELGHDLAAWQPKLTSDALVLLHGTGLERVDDPKSVWLSWTAARSAIDFPEGIGLGVALQAGAIEPFFGKEESMRDVRPLYQLAAARIDAQARADQALEKQAALTARQIWLDSLLADRWRVQEIMDDQERRFEALLADRKQAQLLLEGRQEQLDRWETEGEKLRAEAKQLRAQLKEQKKILSAAKKACRKDGRCFQIATGPKKQRSIAEKILREIARLPRNLRRTRAPEKAPSSKKTSVPVEPSPIDRYAAWIREHEPDAAGLERQRENAQQLETRPKISLLVPVYNTPAGFLDEMFASVSAQTYENWELCVVDGGSDNPETLATLQKWISSEPRIVALRLEENLGIAENTNRALELATGDFMACVDHDDLLAPFALYELAVAIGHFPEAEILYSDEDRWSEQGERHAPYFKPEWSPELLLGSMYIGHLTAYRRSLVERVGRFRKEFDQSQDYDFALRATEQARAIHHLPHVLYHWREHPASGSMGGKPDARKSNLAALEEAMRRRNLPAEIIEYPTANRARLTIARWPRVSVIVPTDSPARGPMCIQDLSKKTSYPDLEIVIVANSGLIESLRSVAAENATVRLVPYDKPFNFSDKCNLGAAAATGERLIFFNDDVEPAQADWIQNLIEPLENPEVGAVSPKLLYENGKIQHAGLVMGVRGLAGTAFHQRAADSTEHFNLAQSLRDVAALSAACMAMRREDFTRLGGFDAVHTPIAHSDIDLCFKIRDAGLRCVYTPYATLGHAGHASIGDVEKKEVVRRRDKASIYLLKRWAHYTTHDPYFTDNMRDWLYSDSPTPIRMAARDRSAAVGASLDLLFVSHDLSLSGAPMMLLHAARWCQENGIFVVVMAPKDGPLSEKLKAEGISLIIDPLVETGHPSFVAFARDFDCIVANTILSGAVVRAMRNEKVPIAWWIHEPASVGEHYIWEDAKLRAALPFADVLVAPSERTGTAYRPFTDRPVRTLRNAIPDIGAGLVSDSDSAKRPLRFLLLGSVEPRKGQDIFVQALALLPAELLDAAEFQIAGRILDPEFWPRVEAVAAPLKNLSVLGAQTHTEALALLEEADVVVSASRDEAMPTVTILEAMSLGKALIATEVGGARETLVDGENALLVRPERPEALAAAVRRLLEDRALVATLGKNARTTYEKSFTMERFGEEFRQLITDAISVPLFHVRAD